MLHTHIKTHVKERYRQRERERGYIPTHCVVSVMSKIYKAIENGIGEVTVGMFGGDNWNWLGFGSAKIYQRWDRRGGGIKGVQYSTV